MSMLTYEIDWEDIIRETPNSVIKLSYIKWGEHDYKYDLRRWTVKANEEEVVYTPNKGISLDEESAKCLTKYLVDRNICNDHEIARILEERHNIKIDIPDPEEPCIEYVDPMEILNC